MTKPQRFASSLRLSRLCRWLLTAAAIKVALLVAFALEQPWPFATASAPPAATVSVVPAPSGQPSQSGVSGAPASTQADAAARTGQAMHAGLAAQAGQTVQSGQDAESQPLAADIARAVGLTAAAAPAPAAGITDARGRMHREGTAWAAEAQPAPATGQPGAAPAAPSSALPAAAGLPGGASGSTGAGMAGASSAPAAAQSSPSNQAGQSNQSNQTNQAALDLLNRKQEDLNRREQELKGLEQQVDAKLAQMQDLEARIKTMLKDAQGMKDEKLRHLVDVYTNMKAKQAAAVLETLDEKIAVRILAGMRGRQAGEILTFVQAEKAAKLSEALTRMQLPLE